MAEIDTSIYGDLTRPDPMGQINQLADTASKVIGAKQAQFEYGGKVRLGQHVRDAIDPATGQLDVNKLVTGLHNDPGAAAAAVEGTNLGLSQTASQIANAQSKINLNQAAFTNLSNAWAARLAQNHGPISSSDLEGDAINLLVQGRITPEVFKSVLRTLPGAGEDARSYAAGGFISTLPPGITAGAYPAPPGPSGAPRQQSGASFVASTTGTGPSDASTVTTGLGPGAEAAIGKVGGAGGDFVTSLAATANEVPNRKAMLQNMAAEADQFTSGPVSEQIKALTASANELFGTKFNLEGVAAQERFDKLANQIAQVQAGALGITDQRERTAMGANPNSKMSNLGIKGNIALLLGNEDAIMVKNAALQNWLAGGGSPDQAWAWSTKFNQMYDPRVFQSVYLSPEENKQLASSMSERERAAFREKYNFAVQNGWIPAPGGSNAQ